MTEAWRIYYEIEDAERDEAEAYAQGAANRLGVKTTLLRIDHGEEIHVGDYKPQPR